MCCSSVDTKQYSTMTNQPAHVCKCIRMVFFFFNSVAINHGNEKIQLYQYNSRVKLFLFVACYYYLFYIWLSRLLVQWVIQDAFDFNAMVRLQNVSPDNCKTFQSVFEPFFWGGGSKKLFTLYYYYCTTCFQKILAKGIIIRFSL